MPNIRLAAITITAALVTVLGSTTIAQEPPPERESLENAYKEDSFSPYANRSFPSQVFWGDTHLHTSISMDAGAIGNRLGPEEAYRFARGEQITSSTGVRAKLSRPLDFLVVSDHSDNMGLFTLLYEGDPVLLGKSEIARELSSKIQKGGQSGMEAAMYIIDQFSQGKLDKSLDILPGTKPYKTTWNMIIDAAEEYNEPGRFTAFIGYEWTSLIMGNNMHRNVIYRDGAQLARQVEPYTTTPPLGSPNPRDLFYSYNRNWSIINRWRGIINGFLWSSINRWRGINNRFL